LVLGGHVRLRIPDSDGTKVITQMWSKSSTRGHARLEILVLMVQSHNAGGGQIEYLGARPVESSGSDGAMSHRVLGVTP